MSQPSKEYLAEYRKKNAEKIRAQQAERDRRKREVRNMSPEALAEYKAKRRADYVKANPNAMTKEQRQANAKTRRRLPKTETRECEDCREVKPLADFAQPGPRGHKAYCLSCQMVRSKASKLASQRKYNKKNRERINAVKLEWAHKNKPVRKKPEPKPVEVLTWKQKLIRDGWRCLGGETDPHEYITVFLKGWIVMYVRGQSGTYSTGKCSFGILFDNSGTRFMQLGKAEARARRLYAS